MRIRTNNKPDIVITSPLLVSRWNNNPPPDGQFWPAHQNNGTFTVVTRRHTEEMIDDPVKASFGSKPCTHTTTTCELYAKSDEVIDYVTADGWNTRWSYKSQYAYWVSWGKYPLEISHSCVSVAATDLRLLVNKAVSRFYDQNDVDTILNLYELPDLVPGLQGVGKHILDASHLIVRSVLPGKRKCLKWIDDGFKPPKLYSVKQMRSWLRKRSNLRERISNNVTPSAAVAAGRDSILALSSIWDAVAAGYLGWSFAVAPLASDIGKIVKSLPGLREKVDRFAKQAKAIRTSHEREEGPVVLINMPRGYAADPVMGQTAYLWWTVKNPSAFKTLSVATVRGTFGHSAGSIPMKKFDYLATRFLGAGPASFLLERIPFSFVAEWFFNLDNLIGKIDSALTGGPKIDDICTSTSYDLFLDLYHVQNTGWMNETHMGETLARVRLKRYSRMPWVSGYDLVYWDSRFGKKQSMLSACLLSPKGRAILKSVLNKR